VGPAAAQIGQTAYVFRTIQPHPYVHALGDATVAARGYSGAIGVNPATIGTEGTVRVGTNVNLSEGPAYSSPWILPASFEDYWITAPSGTVKMNRWAVGVQVKHFSRGSTEIRNPQGEDFGTVNSFDQSIKLAAAYDVNPSVTVGGGVNLIRSRLGARATSTRNVDDTKVHPTIDLGVHYQTRMKRDVFVLRPSLGLSLTDFGGNVSYENQPGDLSAPTTIRGGGALQFTSQSRQFGRPEWRVGLYGALSNLLVSGEYVEKNRGEYFEADGPFTALFNGWGSTKGMYNEPSGDRVKIGSWERLKKHVGVEMSVLDVLSVRVGRFHENDDNGARQYTALGFGLDAYYVSLDASWSLGNESREEYSYGRLTVRIPLSSSPRNFWPALLGGGD